MMIKKTTVIMVTAFGFVSTANSTYTGKMATRALASAIASGSAVYYYNQNQTKDKQQYLQENERQRVERQIRLAQTQNFYNNFEQRYLEKELKDSKESDAKFFRQRTELNRQPQLKFKNNSILSSEELDRHFSQLRFKNAYDSELNRDRNEKLSEMVNGWFNDPLGPKF